MHTTLKVVKQALQQLAKTEAWVLPLEDEEEIDQEAVEAYLRAQEELRSQLHHFIRQED